MPAVTPFEHGYHGDQRRHFAAQSIGRDCLKCGGKWWVTIGRFSKRFHGRMRISRAASWKRTWLPSSAASRREEQRCCLAKARLTRLAPFWLPSAVTSNGNLVLLQAASEVIHAARSACFKPPVHFYGISEASVSADTHSRKVASSWFEGATRARSSNHLRYCGLGCRCRSRGV
jgi:hypothetical protein